MRISSTAVLWALIVLLVAAAACGDDSAVAPSETDGLSDSHGASGPSSSGPASTDGSALPGSGSGPSSGSEAPQTVTPPTPAECEAMVTGPSGIFVEDDGVAVQPALTVLDGDVHVAWTGPGPGESDLAPWFGRLDCADGRWFAEPPRRLNPEAVVSEGLPRLAASGGQVLAVWQRADGMENRVRMLLLDGAGEPVWASPRSLPVEIRGEDVSDRAWQPDVAATPEGGWAVAGTAFDRDWGGFRTFVVLLDSAGEPIGPAISMMPEPPAETASEESGPSGSGSGSGAEEGSEPDGSQAHSAAESSSAPESSSAHGTPESADASELERWHEAPAVLVDAEGAVWVAWDRRSTEKDDTAFTVLRPDGDGGWTVAPARVVLPEETRAVAGPALARIRHGDTERIWLSFAVFPGETAALALDITDPDDLGEPLVLADREAAFRTRLVQVASGQVLAAWQARDSGSSARGVIRTRWFQPNGAGLSPMGAPETAAMRERTTHLVYPLAIAARGDAAVLAWTAGAPELGWRTSLRLLSAP